MAFMTSVRAYHVIVVIKTMTLIIKNLVQDGKLDISSL